MPVSIRKHLQTVFFMFAVTFVFMSLVTGVYLATRATVERNKTLYLKQAVATAAGIPDLTTPERIVAWYATNVQPEGTNGALPAHFWITPPDDPQGRRLVLLQRGPGLWGAITALVGFNADRSAFTAVTFLEHNETPGLGARIDEPWFRRQFEGRTAPFERLLAERKDKSDMAAPPGGFDQITGATITSSGVKTIMNASMRRARELTPPQ
jgi:Na+-transporting NADH:ubiquinone oxidoreductase subunit C